MQFAKNSPIKIVMLGAGGTGAHIATNLYRILYTADRPVRFILVDGDLVEEKNLARQHFTHADLLQNKAQVLAERYSSVFELEAEYVSEYIEDEQRLARLLEADIYHYRGNQAMETVILIGAVDNNRSRQMCDRVFRQAKNLIYIDSGNGEHSGQVVCGVRRGGRTYMKPVSAHYPDILEDEDKFPSELSCAEASVSAPQSLMANVMAATAVNALIYNLVFCGELNVSSLTFSTKSVQMRSHIHKTKSKKEKKTI